MFVQYIQCTYSTFKTVVCIEAHLSKVYSIRQHSNIQNYAAWLMKYSNFSHSTAQQHCVYIHSIVATVVQANNYCAAWFSTAQTAQY